MSSPPESDAHRFGCKVIGVRQSHTCQLISQERKGAIKLDLACYLLRYRHKEQQYLLVPDCSKDSPLFHINMHSIHPKYKSRNIFTSGHLCSSWFSVSVVLDITKKESTAYMKERIWIWLKFHIFDSDLSHSRTSPGRTTRLLMLYLPLVDIQILPGSNRTRQGHHRGRNEQPEARRHWFIFF